MKKILLTYILFHILSSHTASQNVPYVGENYIFFPKHKQISSIDCFAGLSLAQLPTRVVEDVFDQVPMIELKARLSLPYNITAGADLNTNIFTTQLGLHPAYCFSAGKLAFSAGSEMLLWFGFYKTDGFNVSVLGWGYSPFIAAGYDFEDFTLSLRLSADIKAQNTYMRKISYRNASPEFKGTTFSLAVEQPLWGSNWFALGFRANYTTFFYKSWISFSTFEQYTFYPEFFAGFVL